MSRPAIKLYNFPRSGHAHRAELMLSLLQLPTELIFVDLAQGAHKTPQFLALNPFGQVPVIDDGGTIVADSNAILVYLAKRYGNQDWLPEEPAAAAKVQRWLSAAAGPLAFGACAARLVTVFGYSFNSDEVINRAHAMFSVMEGELNDTPFLAGAKPMSPTTPTPPMRRRATFRWSPIRTSAPGWPASKRCRASCRCRVPPPVCKPDTQPLPGEPAAPRKEAQHATAPQPVFALARR